MVTVGGEVDASAIEYALATEDYIEQFLPLIQDELTANGTLDGLIQTLESHGTAMETQLGDRSMESVGDLVGSMDVIKAIVKRSGSLGVQVKSISREIGSTGADVIQCKRKLNMLTQLEGRIAETGDIVSVCMEILGKTNKVLTLIQKFEFFRALSELNSLNEEQLRDLDDYEFVNKIYESIPLFQKMITDESLEQLNSWLNVTVSKSFSDIGEYIYDAFEEMNEDWEVKQMSDANLIYYKVNSKIERTFRESKFLNIDPIERLGIDMTPLYHAYLVFKEINDLETLNDNLSNGLLKLRDTLLVPFRENSITNTDSLRINLYQISSFCVFDSVISEKTDYAVRSRHTVEVSNKILLGKIHTVLNQYIGRVFKEQNSLAKFERINDTIGIFYQLLINWGFESSQVYSLMTLNLDGYLKGNFEFFKYQYNELVNRELWEGVTIESEDQFKLIKSQVFHMFKVENPAFPMKAPFSKIYADTCKLIRGTIIKIYKFIGRYYGDGVNQIMRQVNDFIDKILREVVLRDLKYQINSAYESVKSQNLINLDFFCSSNYEIENWINLSSNETLMKFRSPTKMIKLRVKEEFETTKHVAEVNLLQNLTGMIENLIDTNDSEWVSLYWTNDTYEEGIPNGNVETAMGFLYDTFLFKFKSLPGHTKASLALEAIDKVSQLLMESIFKASMISVNGLRNFEVDVSFIGSTIDRFYDEGTIIEEADIHREVLKNVLVGLYQIVRVLTELNVEVIKDGGTKMKLREEDARSLLRKYEGYKTQQAQREAEKESLRGTPVPEQDDDDNRSMFAFKY